MSIAIGNKRKGDQGIYVGRPNPLGNPFVIGRDGEREDVIAKYSEWLNVLLQDPDSIQSREIGRLTQLARKQDITLVCWCCPLACHAEVIRDAINERI